MSPVRALENRFYRSVRDPRAALATDAETESWSTEPLRAHKYCLLTSYRRSGEAVHTPVWFGIDDGRIYIRSGAGDGKVKRIHRNARVRVTPCTARGKPLGQPMEGVGRVLDVGEWERAEAALRRHYGLGRKLYRLVRRRLDVAYLEVVGP